MTLLHLAYLQQLSELLDNHKPLAARYGYIANEIAQKFTVHTKGVDAPKLLHCFACQAPITCSNIKPKGGKIIVHCDLCDLRRHYSISRRKKDRKKNVGDRLVAKTSAEPIVTEVLVHQPNNDHKIAACAEGAKPVAKLQKSKKRN